MVQTLHRRLALLGRDKDVVMPRSDVSEGARASEACRLLFRKGHRRRVSAERRSTIEGKVSRAIAEGQPLCLVIPFGGYKHFWNPSAPRVDWAEVFHLEFMIDYLEPLIPLVPAGLRVEYVSEDFIVPLMDNYSPDELDQYSQSFRSLLARYERVLPAGLSFDYWRLSDRYDTDAITRDIVDAMPERLAEFASLGPDLQAIELRRSRRSVNWTGWHDLSSLLPTERDSRIVYARVMEKTFSDLGFLPQHVGGYYEAEFRSCVVFSWGTSPDNAVKQFLTLHSSWGSMVDHWIGRGVVIPAKGGRLRTTIFSRTQYESFQWTSLASEVEGLDSALINLSTFDLLVT